MRRTSHPIRRLLLLALVAVPLLAPASSARTNGFGDRPLSRGSTGNDVIELQIRVSGWYANSVAGAGWNEHLKIDGIFGPRTERSVRNYQKANGLPVTGRMDSSSDFRPAWDLEDSDGTTHFNHVEFVEKRGSQCSTANAGTYNGGKVAASTVQEHVRRLMYRLEVVRAKFDNAHPIRVTSGYRSVAYNDCLKRNNKNVATTSQHMYGTASDVLMSNVNNGRVRSVAKTSMVSGIFCYSSAGSHNHLDIRADNNFDGNGGFTGRGWAFAWPPIDSAGRDLQSHGGPQCAGGFASPPSTGTKDPAVGLPVPDPLGPLGDPNGPSDAEARAKQTLPEEVWMADDLDDAVNAVTLPPDSQN